MKRPSIRKRLILWTGLLTGFAMVTGILILYWGIKKSLLNQFDEIMNEAASLVMIEVEVKNGKVFHEWKEAIKNDDTRRESLLIQAWDKNTGETFKSPALGTGSLERRSGALNERIFYNLTLPNGERGRAMATEILPTLEGDGNKGFDVTKHPQIFIWADSTEPLLRELENVRKNLILGAVAFLGLIWIAIWAVVSKSLLPISELSREIASRTDDHLGAPLPIPGRLPVEIVGAAENFNILLKRIEGQRERDREFSLHVSHELRTPLSGIQTTLEQCLSKDRSGQDYKERVRKALTITEGLRRMVGRLMRFSRLSRSTEVIAPEKLNIRKLIDRQCFLLEEQIEDAKLKIAWVVDQTEFWGIADRELLAILFANLIGNAISYSPPHTSIHLKLEEDEQKTSFSISNKATDLCKGDLSRLFEPFFRQAGERGARGDHSGIGLSLCSEIIRVLGGTIKANLDQKNTITFTVTLFKRLPEGNSPGSARSG